ncbi:outer membrane beta-barrel protein [Aquimarina sp. 2201CG5-10]|uniref:outer membrane beta-barrel protein n=1 Tax=Aquimarina callyspongiae TaxID=3098150 RepID=UPI002AB5B97A|nr:outer membrane beta-barrel protein [Aquimarina sp. 2201CG5-10]MDY8134143.1 outer membrane beta-barrel protein [Aquimarina sp. 2201CG5-10]
MKTKTKTNLLKKVCLVALAFISLTTMAQEEEEKWFDNFSIHGSIDGYYRYNIDASNQATGVDVDGENIFAAPGTSFADKPGFALGMANLILGYEGEKVGFVADLVYGPRGTDAVGNNSGSESASIVNQLYVYWKVSKKVKLTFGNFNTYLGYEAISPTGNFNYSTSYMFSNGPFSHTGIRADFTLNDKWSAMLAVMNPTDLTDFNPHDTYIIGAQLGYTVDNGSAYLNFRYGNEGAPGPSEPTFQADLTTGWDIDESFFLGFNGTYTDTDGSGFYGAALYPQYKTSEKFALGLRGEYFNVFTDVDAIDDVDVIAVTLTGSYDVGDLTLKPELRIDSSDDAFVNKDLETSSNLSSFVLGAIYKF